MKKLLITGVAGFIGSRIAKRFLLEGYDVVGVDNLHTGFLKNVPEGVDFRNCDVRDRDKLLGCCLGQYDAILHLAGQSSGEISFDDPVADLGMNAITTLNLVELSMKTSTSKIVYASSMSVYGDQVSSDGVVSENSRCSPLSCYGISKLAAERYLRCFSSQVDYVNLRMFNVYGPGQDLSNLRQGMVSIFVAQAIKNKHISVKGSLGRFRDFIYIDDVVEAWYRAATDNEVSEMSLNLGTGVKTSVGDLIEAIRLKEPEITVEELAGTPGDQFGIVADTEKLSKVLDVSEFTRLDEGIDNMLMWARGGLS